MTEENKKRLYYITQYADYMTDEDFYQSVDNHIKSNDLDINLFAEISELMTEISDRYNVRIYDKMWQAKDDADLLDLIDLLNAIIDEDSDKVAEVLEVDLWDFLTEREIYTPDLLEELADEDLRVNGVNASALYWVKEINYTAKYQGFNGYANGFYDYDDADIIEMLLDEYY
ncbi:MAG: hypothetical protein BWY30_01151 [Tenericutes bacterium ADurb.Bin239]|nr:MAG: hypothetical protein BWY30_01151 [Tenericutes bacterium ADurb.Bin239]